MMRSLPPWLRRTLLLLLSVIVLCCLILFWLLRTESGTSNLIRFALSQADVPVQIEKIKGTVGSGLTLSGITYTSDELTVEVKTTRLTVRLADLISREVIVDRLHVDNVLIVSSGSAAAAPVNEEPFELPGSVDLPVDIILHDFELNELSFGVAGESTEQLVSRLGLTAAWIDRQLSISGINAQTSVGELNGSAKVETAQPYELDLNLNSTIELESYPQLVSQTTLGGSLEDLTIDHRSDAPYSLSVVGVVENAMTDPGLNITLKTQNTSLEQIVGESVAVSLTSNVAVQGGLDALDVSGTANTTLPEVGSSSAAFQGVVKPTELQLSELVLSLQEVGKGATIGVSGTVNWSAAPVFDVSVDWDRLPWPPKGEPVAVGVNGTAQLEGSLESYRLDVNSGLESQLQKEGSISIAATGTPEQIDIQNVLVAAFEGSIQGSGRVFISNGLDISAQLEGSKVNPRAFLPDWPGEIDFNTSATARVVDSTYTVTLPELAATGELRGYPLDATVSGELRDTGVTIRKMDVTSGETKLNVSGKVSGQIGLNWTLESEDLASLWPDLTGKIEADGELTGSKDRPVIDASVNGTALKYQDLYIDKLKAAVKLGQSETYEGTALVDVTDLRAGSYKADSLRVGVAGLGSGHELTVNLKDTLGETRVEALGSLTEENEYSLKLNTAVIDSKDLGTWATTEPVTVQVKNTLTKVPQTCLAQDSSKLCFAVISQDNDISADVEVVDVPLSLFAYVLPATVKASGRINGGGNMLVSVNNSSYGKLQFDLDGLKLESRIRQGARDSTLSFGPATLVANVTESGALTANANFPLASGGGLSFDASLLEEDKPVLDRTLRGELVVAVPSVGFVADFVPQLSQTKGGLEGQITLSGSVRRPEVLGSLALQNGELTLVDPGVQATDVSMRLTGSRNRAIAIEGSAKSGGGEIKLNGKLALSDEGNTGEFKLNGSEFQVLNTSDAQVWATPDIELAYSDEAGLKLTGFVDVPRAKVEIGELPKGTVRVSKDQIIVGQEQKKEATSIPVEAELKLSLGDDVFLSAFGLETFLAGSLTLIESSGRPTAANGEIQLRDGKYEAYGQSLTITTGNLVYAGGAIDEPGVDFRAVRNPVPEIEVGISARGTLNQPGFSVFSTPSMSESDQLAYLIFGRPMNAEAASENTLITRLALSLGMKGGESLSQKLAGELGVDQLGIESQGSGDLSQASLVIGKYISPKLFISYGIGLLEPISTLKLQYALSSKWQLITESSSTRNSADAQYTFER
ncbi:MAG: translocation/assembly module TamB domain-containing protein [Gammaproteobacteria bacterium]